MKKLAAIFLVLVLVFSFVGCNTATNEETATTQLIDTNSKVEEVVLWAMANVMSKISATRYVDDSIYDEVKKELEDYINSLPPHAVPKIFEIEKPIGGLFKIIIEF